MVSGGTGIEGSSESDSGGAGGGTASGAGRDAWGVGKFKMLPLVATVRGRGGTS